jgi:hypothetical protein
MKKEKWTKLLCHLPNGNTELIQSDGNGKMQNFRKYEEHAKSGEISHAHGLVEST